MKDFLIVALIFVALIVANQIMADGDTGPPSRYDERQQEREYYEDSWQRGFG